MTCRLISVALGVLGAAVLFTLPSCSTYSADFARAVAEAEIPPGSPAGPWVGRWHSDSNGHEGPLWCIITPVPGEAGAYDFRYRAGWGRLQFGDYTSTVNPAVSGTTWKVVDEMDLPGGFGTYSIKGTVTPKTFQAAFKSDNGDHGTMTLTRPN